MKGKQLADLRERMGWSKAKAAELLGCGRNQIATYEAADEVPLMLALACAARANGLPPYGGTQPAAPMAPVAEVSKVVAPVPAVPAPKVAAPVKVRAPAPKPKGQTIV